MISHHHKCLFVHIPKNAGQSIEHVFLDLLNLDWKSRSPLLLRYNDNPHLGPPRLAHLKARDYVRLKYMDQQGFNDYFKFSFIRNPWDRMVSFYKYLDPERKDDFKGFLMTRFRNELWFERYWFVCPQSEFLYSDGGSLLVDFIGRFERLQEDFNTVCDCLGIAHASLPHVNRSSQSRTGLSSLKTRIFRQFRLEDKNAKSGESFRQYYDDESKRVVADLYQKDIDLFGFEF